MSTNYVVYTWNFVTRVTIPFLLKNSDINIPFLLKKIQKLRELKFVQKNLKIF